MSLLVRLYPASWRARYGDELEAVLEDRPPSPFDIADLLLGALDAHLHLRGLGNRSEHRKGIPMSLRLAGYAAIVGGVLWGFIFTALAVSATTGADLSALLLVGIVAAVALLVALAGLSSFQFRHHPRWIWIAFLVPAVGLCATILGLVLLPLGDRPLVGGVYAWGLMIIGLFASLGGSVIFAITTFATASLSRSAAAAVAIGAVVTVPGMMGSLNAAPMMLIGGIVFGLGWIGLGIDAIRRDRATVPGIPAGPTAAA